MWDVQKIHETQIDNKVVNLRFVFFCASRRITERDFIEYPNQAVKGDGLAKHKKEFAANAKLVAHILRKTEGFETHTHTKQISENMHAVGKSASMVGKSVWSLSFFFFVLSLSLSLSLYLCIFCSIRKQDLTEHDHRAHGAEGRA